MPARTATTSEAAAILDEEIRWLASFGWTNLNIAQRLHISISCVEQHLTGKKAGPGTRSKSA